MNPEAKLELERILGLDKNNLTQDDILFLRARRSYLNKSQTEEYSDIIEAKPPKQETAKSNAKSK